MMRSGNPTLNDKTFENFGAYSRDLSREQNRSTTMTISGTVHKTAFLLLLAMGSACFTWSRTFGTDPATAMPRVGPRLRNRRRTFSGRHFRSF